MVGLRRRLDGHNWIFTPSVSVHEWVGSSYVDAAEVVNTIVVLGWREEEQAGFRHATTPRQCVDGTRLKVLMRDLLLY